jgi:hypothetical protein
MHPPELGLSNQRKTFSIVQKINVKRDSSLGQRAAQSAHKSWQGASFKKEEFINVRYLWITTLFHAKVTLLAPLLPFNLWLFLGPSAMLRWKTGTTDDRN